MFQPIIGLAGFFASPPPPPTAAAEGAPTQEELVQNEIDYGNELNQTQWPSADDFSGAW